MRAFCRGIRGHRPRFARPPRIPTVCRRHPVQIFLLSISLEQAQIRLFVKIFAERGGFEPPKPFWSLHAFQACLFNHSSISPSSQLACKKKLALRVWLAAVAPLNSGSQYSPKIKILGDPISPSLGFHDYHYALVALTAALRH